MINSVYIDANNLAASFQNAVIDVLVSKTSKAAQNFHVKQVIIAGGVAANKGLRTAMKDEMDKIIRILSKFNMRKTICYFTH